jgi:hypothetical protein
MHLFRKSCIVDISPFLYLSSRVAFAAEQKDSLAVNYESVVTADNFVSASLG